ncbi:MAG: hypothetical protein EA381_20430 [Planctomycetaceae bacterium]|nr:MAG: hypothetical protein EA381_20430 [Planctomycetaceae bacterium]
MHSSYAEQDLLKCLVGRFLPMRASGCGASVEMAVPRHPQRCWRASFQPRLTRCPGPIGSVGPRRNGVRGLFLRMTRLRWLVDNGRASNSAGRRWVCRQANV